MRFQPPEPIMTVLRRLRAAGFEACLVGGCVRDELMGIAPYDYDICTAATPEEVSACFSDLPAVGYGARHGTTTVILSHMPIEITTYRTDGVYLDGRRPEKVMFSRSLQEDLARRDFTVNAMAMRENGEIVDLFGGQNDLAARRIVCVGDPEKRFSEDALRILRAMRFASRLQFFIAPDTAKAMKTCAARLAMISRERIAAELNGILLGADAARVLSQHADELFTVLPALRALRGSPKGNRQNREDLWEHTLRVVEKAPSDLTLRWAALLHACGEPFHIPGKSGETGPAASPPLESGRIAEGLLQSLRQPNNLILEVSILLSAAQERIGVRNVRLWLSKLGPERFQNLLFLKRAGVLPDPPGEEDTDSLKAESERILREGLPLSLRDLSVNGEDLIALGIQKGRRVGETLNYLLQSVLTDQVQNDREALIAAALKYGKDSFDAIQ